ncbi:MAG: nitrogenase molybdenum-cofactor synthesis protein NifE [Clostridiales bacterium]|nr:nitrogenase molybdenum-cofactor synthesis protein NifE [Clostridiales bacterium]
MLNELEERQDFIVIKGRHKKAMKCDSHSVSGSVSQRACVYSGARVVLNPIADAVHLVHGPIGCAAYTWDIRGSLSSGSELYRRSFCTDLKERDIVFGGNERLAAAIDKLVQLYAPKLIFVYATCVVGVIGDDLEAVCKAASSKYGIEVIPVQSSGFMGNKAAGYRAACNALLKLIGPVNTDNIGKSRSINYLGDFNLAAETWIISNYFRSIGIEINAVLTGDSEYAKLKKTTDACLNIVQCAGSMNYLAHKLNDLYGMPYIDVSFLGIQDTSESLRKVAAFFNDDDIMLKTEELIKSQTAKANQAIELYKHHLRGKKAAIYVGGGFKAISLLKQFREIGIDVVMIGTQNGQPHEYDTLQELADEGVIIVDDANTSELEQFILEKGADILVGGVKERFLAYKLGVAFIDHNHNRKHPLSGYEGAVNFAKEVYSTVCSPVWKYALDQGGDLAR